MYVLYVHVLYQFLSIIRKLLVDSYNSLTTRDYTPAQLNTGMEQLPASLYQGGRVSGYVHNAPNTRAPLVELTSSDTAYRNYYPLKQFRSDSNHPSMHTNKEESGFTHACNQEPITYRPTECHAGGLPGHLTWRPTGHSITRVDFKQAPLKSGHEAFSQLSFRACHSNGFVKGNCVPAQAEPIDQKVHRQLYIIMILPCALFCIVINDQKVDKHTLYIDCHFVHLYCPGYIIMSTVLQFSFTCEFKCMLTVQL